MMCCVRRVYFSLISLLLLCCFLPGIYAKPLRNVMVILNGRIYQVSDVSTVGELRDRVQEVSGCDPNDQGSIFFRGNQLKSSDILSKVGVSDGAVVSISNSQNAAANVVEENLIRVAEDLANFFQDIFQSSEKDRIFVDLRSEEWKSKSFEDRLNYMLLSIRDVMNALESLMNDDNQLEEVRKVFLLEKEHYHKILQGTPYEDILDSPAHWQEAIHRGWEYMFGSISKMLMELKKTPEMLEIMRHSIAVNSVLRPLWEDIGMADVITEKAKFKRYVHAVADTILSRQPKILGTRRWSQKSTPVELSGKTPRNSPYDATIESFAMMLDELSEDDDEL